MGSHPSWVRIPRPPPTSDTARAGDGAYRIRPGLDGIAATARVDYEIQPWPQLVARLARSLPLPGAGRRIDNSPGMAWVEASGDLFGWSHHPKTDPMSAAFTITRLR